MTFIKAKRNVIGKKYVSLQQTEKDGINRQKHIGK